MFCDGVFLFNLMVLVYVLFIFEYFFMFFVVLLMYKINNSVVMGSSVS